MLRPLCKKRVPAQTAVHVDGQHAVVRVQAGLGSCSWGAAGGRTPRLTLSLATDQCGSARG